MKWENWRERVREKKWSCYWDSLERVRKKRWSSCWRRQLVSWWARNEVREKRWRCCWRRWFLCRTEHKSEKMWNCCIWLRFLKLVRWSASSFGFGVLGIVFKGLSSKKHDGWVTLEVWSIVLQFVALRSFYCLKDLKFWFFSISYVDYRV